VFNIPAKYGNPCAGSSYSGLYDENESFQDSEGIDDLFNEIN